MKKYNCDMTLKEFMEDSKWNYAFNESLLNSPRGVINYKGDLSSFSKKDIKAIIAIQSGEPEGSSGMRFFWLGLS